MNNLKLEDLQAVKLKPTSNKCSDRSGFNANNALPEAQEEEEERRKYFFATGVGVAFDPAVMEQYTFRSINIELSRQEAEAICQYWQTRSKKLQAGEIPEITPPESLRSFMERIDTVIDKSFSSTGAFVKLTTRSAKDSKATFCRAEKQYRKLTQDVSEDDYNTKMTVLARCLAKEQCCHSGAQSLTQLLDSERVFEDLTFALEDTANWTVGVTVREWDERVTIESEFRGMVWNKQLNALGQYFHPLHFPQLTAVQQQIGGDCRAFFDEIKQHINLDNYIVDFSWLGPGRVLLIEVNPFDGVLGSFPCSTGLFDWDRDYEMIHNGPFEMRVRKSPKDANVLKFEVGKDWRRVVFGC
jgi:hypothetical protein